MDKTDSIVVTCTKPDMWPTIDGLPEADVSDLVLFCC
jgi:hypothetical protein